MISVLCLCGGMYALSPVPRLLGMGFLAVLLAGPEVFQHVLYKLSKSRISGGNNLSGELPSENSVGLFCALALSCMLPLWYLCME